MCFFEEKVHPSRCSPRASCYLEQGARGSYLKIVLILRRRAPEHIPGYPSSFCRESLNWFVLKKSSWWRVFFSKKKVHSLSVAPEHLALWNKKLEGLESYVVWKLLSWRSLLSDVRFFLKKVHSLSVAPEPLAIWNKELEGLDSELFKELKTSSIATPSWIWIVQRTGSLSYCSPRAYTWVLLFKKNSDTGSWHVLW